MKWEKDPKNYHDPHFGKNNKSSLQHLKDRLAHIGRKMTRGAANIYRMMKSRAKWGNKHLWRRKDKGGHGRYGGGGE